MKAEDYDRSIFWIGVEVEHTPAYGKKTLFVSGVRDIYEINRLAKANDCTHVYFGANNSFPKLDSNSVEWSRWETMIKDALRSGYFCTLDLDVSCVQGLHESGLSEFSKFIPMISVKMPYLQLLGYNATIKIDDIGFDKTNPGVWCHRLHTLMNPDCFTEWGNYESDSKQL